MSTTDTAYLAIIDELETRLLAAETRLATITAHWDEQSRIAAGADDRIATLEAEISARVAGQRSDHERIAALEAAATALLHVINHLPLTAQWWVAEAADAMRVLLKEPPE